MNQILREFEKQSGLEIYGLGTRRVKWEAAMERFAKLIVRECVQTLLNNTPERYTNEAAEEDWDKGYDRAMRDCVHHIQEHFGVEE